MGKYRISESNYCLIFIFGPYETLVLVQLHLNIHSWYPKDLIYLIPVILIFPTVHEKSTEFSNKLPCLDFFRSKKLSQIYRLLHHF